MKLPRSKKARRRMFGLIFLYSGIILSLGTSTMAWYSVQANVNIDVESASITIKTPFQYHFYAYNLNGFDPSDPPTYAGTGYSSTTLEHLRAIGNYTEINELAGGSTVGETYNADYLTKVDGLWPGYSMSFAIKAEGLATGEGGDFPTLKIVKSTINPGDGAANEITQKRYIGSGTTNHLYLAQAMQVSAWSGANIDSMTAASPMTALNKTWWNPGTIAETGLDGTETTINLGQAASDHSGTYWWFFTVTFSNTNTTYYKEMSSPAATTNEIHYEADPENGNSSCYEGLPFSLGEMTLKND